MAKNLIIRPKTIEAIDKRVERVLRDLSTPEPPLDLRQVFELLKLDRGYYTADDPGLTRTVVSRIWVGAQQILKRPTLIFDVAKKLDLRGFYLPDQKRILIDDSQPVLKHRWLEAHEIGHSLLNWHEGAMFGDSKYTLLPECHHSIEAEANFAAGRLLFLRDQFSVRALDYEPSINAVKELKPQFGNSFTTTFWRCIETWGAKVPMVGLITDHPHPDRRKADFDPAKPCRHFVQSPAFAKMFSTVPEQTVYQIVEQYTSAARGGPLGHGEYSLTDDNGDEHHFYFETFNFRWDVLTLGIYQSPRSLIIAV